MAASLVSDLFDREAQYSLAVLYIYTLSPISSHRRYSFAPFRFDDFRFAGYRFDSLSGLVSFNLIHRLTYPFFLLLLLRRLFSSTTGLPTPTRPFLTQFR